MFKAYFLYYYFFYINTLFPCLIQVHYNLDNIIVPIKRKENLDSSMENSPERNHNDLILV